jgi:hypothetical protein
MFIRVETYNRLIPMWKSISYINLSNVLCLEVEKKHINFYTIFKPKYSAYRINFQSEDEAKKFAEQTFAQISHKIRNLPVSNLQKRFHQDEANPDAVATAAMEDWQQKQLK